MAIANWSNARHILCIRLDTLGDVIMMEPAIRALQSALPGRRITLLTSPSGAEAGPLMPSVHQTIAYAAPWMKSTAGHAVSLNDRRFASQLRQARFDGAVIFTCFSQSALPAAMLCYLADIPLRLAHCRENPYQLLTDWVRDREPEEGIRHEVQRQLDLVATLDAKTQDERICLRVPRLAQQSALCELRRCGVGPSQPWIVVHAGATAASRRWPPEFFAEAADLLTLEAGHQIVFTGTSMDRQLVQYIRSQMKQPSYSLVGRLDVSQLAGLLSLAPLLISNNTGPVHLAAGVGTPVIDVYALTNPQHTPWRVPSRVLSANVPCKYCFRSDCPEGHQQCLRGVLPGEVVAAATDLLRELAESPPAVNVAG